MIGQVVRLLTGDVSRLLAQAYADKNNAETEQQRIAAEARVRALEIQQQARAQGGVITAWVQAAWAAPFIIYAWKLLVWDKVMGLGATDPLSPELVQDQKYIIGFYFGSAAVIGVARVFRK